MRLIGYIPVRASQDARENRSSRRRQHRERIQALATAKGHVVTDWREDLDQPGSKWSRPGFQRRSRPSRTERPTGSLSPSIASPVHRGRGPSAGTARSRRRRPVAVDLGIDSSTSSGRLMQNVLMALAEFELERVRENWTAAGSHAATRGVHVCRVPPTGYLKAEDACLELDPEAAPVVRELFRRRATGRPGANSATCSTSVCRARTAASGSARPSRTCSSAAPTWVRPAAVERSTRMRIPRLSPARSSRLRSSSRSTGATAAALTAAPCSQDRSLRLLREHADADPRTERADTTTTGAASGTETASVRRRPGSASAAPTNTCRRVRGRARTRAAGRKGKACGRHAGTGARRAGRRGARAVRVPVREPDLGHRSRGVRGGSHAAAGQAVDAARRALADANSASPLEGVRDLRALWPTWACARVDNCSLRPRACRRHARSARRQGRSGREPYQPCLEVASRPSSVRARAGHAERPAPARGGPATSPLPVLLQPRQ